jgi:hypothetical protein
MEFIKVIIKYLPYFWPAAWLTLEITILGILMVYFWACLPLC